MEFPSIPQYIPLCSGDNTTCVPWVERWLLKVHHLDHDIKTFGGDDGFQTHFDMSNYTKVFQHNDGGEAEDQNIMHDECKVGHI